MAPKLVYVVTEDWYFLGHRLPMAQVAQAAGFDVHVITRVEKRGAEIEALGFMLHPIAWSRRSLSLLEAFRSIVRLRAILRRIAPAVVHNVALKPAVMGSIAALGLGVNGLINSINGLGSALLNNSWRGMALQKSVSLALSRLFNRSNVVTIVQNPDDFAAFQQRGINPDQIVLIPGSGVDVAALRPLPEPVAPPVRFGFVGRMPEDKGVRTLVEALRTLRREGEAVELVLAGTPEPENPTSISDREPRAWDNDPGISWAGHVKDISAFWAQSHVAILPSRREGLPKSLLEAAACGRPMVAADVSGCREVCIAGETGLLARVDDADRLAGAMRTMCREPALRLKFGRRSRAGGNAVLIGAGGPGYGCHLRENGGDDGQAALGFGVYRPTLCATRCSHTRTP